MDIPDHISEGIDAISALHARSERLATPHQRTIERLTNALGRPLLLYAIAAVVLVWTVLNTALQFAGMPAPDPPPFPFLQGVLTLSALLIATMVLITQNRQMKTNERRSHLDLEVNLLAERKVAKVISLLEELRRDLPNVRNRYDPEAEAMLEHADPHAVAAVLEKTIEAEVRADLAGQDADPPKP